MLHAFMLHSCHIDATHVDRTDRIITMQAMLSLAPGTLSDNQQGRLWPKHCEAAWKAICMP